MSDEAMDVVVTLVAVLVAVLLVIAGRPILRWYLGIS